MEKEYFISVYLDTRRKLKNNKYPVRLRVFTPLPRKQKLFPTIFEFKKREFKSIWETEKPQNSNKEKRREIQSIIDKAEDVAKTISPFSFYEFERKLYLKSGDAENVFTYYNENIKNLKETGRFGTAVNYQYSLNSLINFVKYTTGKEPDKLLFRELTPHFLTRYEYYMLKEKDKSPTTVGIYLRPLRALFNAAIADKNVKPELYPFGKRLYQIPAPKAVKKALTSSQLKQLHQAKHGTPEQEKAKDFWFFLFNTAGMNVKDLAFLKYENIQGDRIVYIREKTKQTSKADLKPVLVFLNTYGLSFIKKYGNPMTSPKDLVFPIIDENMTDEQKFGKVKNFTRFINQNLQKLAKANGLPEEISTYWSRHSFATNAIRSGASLEQISQALNHHDLSTTKNYFAGFEDETMKKLTDNLMNFD